MIELQEQIKKNEQIEKQNEVKTNKIKEARLAHEEKLAVLEKLSLNDFAAFFKHELALRSSLVDEKARSENLTSKKQKVILEINQTKALHDERKLLNQENLQLVKKKQEYVGKLREAKEASKMEVDEKCKKFIDEIIEKVKTEEDQVKLCEEDNKTCHFKQLRGRYSRNSQFED